MAEISIGDRIKFLREEKRMTQAQLAEALGVSRMTVNNYEQGKRIPDIDFAVKTAAYFCVTVEYLSGRTAFRDKDDIKVSVEKAENLIHTMEQLPQDKCQELLKNLNILLVTAHNNEFHDSVLRLLNNCVCQFTLLLEGYEKLERSIVPPIVELRRRNVPQGQIELAMRDKEKAIGYYGFEAKERMDKALENCLDDLKRGLEQRKGEALAE
ncbi:MAG: helix-turn-helix transcriptional regulator [Lachnospiraceae bacterium]|nr:helix-turn-helix transcriptional regulator [Lachnospiraceae bacterium]